MKRFLSGLICNKNRLQFCLIVSYCSVVKVVSLIHESRTANNVDVSSNDNFQ